MMNRNKFIKSFIITTALVMSVGINSYAETGTITGDSIRLRKENNTESTVIDIYNNGQKVEVIEKDGEWYKVTIDKKTGYIYQDYISVDKDKTAEDKENEKVEETDKKEDVDIEETKSEEQNTKTDETKKEDKGTVKLGTIKSATTQKIYILPNIGSSVIGEVKQDSDVDIIQEVNGWAYVSTDELSGWSRYEKIANEEEKDKISTYEEKEDNQKDEEVEEKQEEKKETDENKTTDKNTEKKEEKIEEKETNSDVAVTEKKAYISGDNVNFRKQPNTSADVIKGLNINTEITIIAENGNWYKIKIDEEVGYVSKDYISDSKVKVTTSRATEEEREIKKTTSGKVTGEDIATYAQNYLGYSYVYGAQSPATGFDCSGLVWYVYKHFGYNVSRTAAALAGDGKNISKKSDLQPGDILIFKDYMDYSQIGHVGIYIGNNEFIHANDESTGVIITSLDYGKYPERFISGRRIVD